MNEPQEKKKKTVKGEPAPKKAIEPSKPKAKLPAPGARRKETLNKLEGELANLRSDLDEIMEQLRLKLQSRLAGIQARVAGTQPGADPQPPLSLLAAEKALALVKELNMKPSKGRMKDLAKVDELLDVLRKGLRGN